MEVLGAFYKEEIRRRANLLLDISRSIEKRQRVLKYISYRENMIGWMCDWCWTFDNRNANLGLPTVMPWIPWQKQIEFIEWTYNLYLNQQGGLIEKSRDAGATWLFCAIQLREWRWEDGFGGGFGSNKFESVDKKDNQKCIFYKLRTLFENLPHWQMPEGFDRKVHDKVGNLVNPENGANIVGEGGDDIGRGDRRSMYVVDEKAYLEHPDAVDAALSQTTDCQFDLSTPHGLNNFGIKRHSGRVKVFTFHWKEDPRKDQQWRDKQDEELDPVIVAQEVEIDYHASVENLCIPAKHVRAAVELKLNPSGVRSGGLDVAAGGTNRSALALRIGPIARVLPKNFDNGIDLAFWAIEKGNEFQIEYLNYDKPGVGHAVHSTVSRIDPNSIRFRVYGIEGQKPASEIYYAEYNRKGNEIFLNLRAEAWVQMAKRFEKTYEHVCGVAKYPHDELISIENDAELISQLSSPKKQYTPLGKIKIESKEDMLKRGIKSPDEADALAMALMPQEGGKRHVLEYYKQPSKPFRIKFSTLSENNVLVVSQWVEPNYKTGVLLGLWNSVKGKLYVWGEFEFDNSAPEIVVPAMIKYLKKFSEKTMTDFSKFDWIGNRGMFAKKKSTDVGRAVIDIYRNYGLYIRENGKYDEDGSIYFVNRLITKNALVLHNNVSILPERMRDWTIQGDRPAKGFEVCRALCNMVSSLFETGQVRTIKPKMKEYSEQKMQFDRQVDRLAKLDRLHEVGQVEIREGEGEELTKDGWF